MVGLRDSVIRDQGEYGNMVTGLLGSVRYEIITKAW